MRQSCENRESRVFRLFVKGKLFDLAADFQCCFDIHTLVGVGVGIGVNTSGTFSSGSMTELIDTRHDPPYERCGKVLRL